LSKGRKSLVESKEATKREGRSRSEHANMTIFAKSPEDWDQKRPTRIRHAERGEKKENRQTGGTFEETFARDDDGRSPLNNKGKGKLL